MSERGKFIVLEGIDGSGKSSQATDLWRTFRLLIDTELTQEHWRKDIFGQAIDAVVEQKKEPYDPLALQFGFISNRINHTMALIKPMLAEGKRVICDRYLESTIAYANDEDRPGVILATDWLIERGGILKPDITFLLDISAEVAMGRCEERKCRNDGEEGQISKVNRQSIFEGKLASYERVRKNYLERFSQGRTDMVVIDGTGERKKIGHQIIDELIVRKI